MELGDGFAFVGRESRLIVGETEFFTDLLFYNIKLHAYVVIEVKTTKFNPGDLGQLSTYVSSINHLLKGKNDNPTIGILICKDKDARGRTLEAKINDLILSNIFPKDLENAFSVIREYGNRYWTFFFNENNGG